MLKKSMLSVMALITIMVFGLTIDVKAAQKEQPKQPPASRWNQVLQAAKKEGKLVMYTGTGTPVRDAIVKKFGEKFGIEVEMLTVPTNELLARMLGERKAGINNVDLAISGVSLVNAKKEKALLPLDPYLILPEVLDPKAWPRNQLPFFDNEHTLITLTAGFHSYILVNTERVAANEVTSYLDLLNPKWKGQIIMSDPITTGPPLYWMMYILEMALGHEKGDKFLKQLAAEQALTLTTDQRLSTEWVARGKYAIAIAPNTDAVTAFLKSGAAISRIHMKEGGLVQPGAGNISLLDKAPHPNAATVMLNWLLSKEGSSVFANAQGQPAIRADVSVEGVEPSLRIPKEGKVYWLEEGFTVLTETKGRDIARGYFGALLK